MLYDQITNLEIGRKRLEIDMCIIHEMIAKKEVYSIEWCKSQLRLTDCSTKGTVNCMKPFEVTESRRHLLK